MKDEAFVQQITTTIDDIFQAEIDHWETSVNHVAYRTGPEDVDDVIKSMMPMREGRTHASNSPKQGTGQGTCTLTLRISQSSVHRQATERVIRKSKTQVLIEHKQRTDGPVEPTTVSHNCQNVQWDDGSAVSRKSTPCSSSHATLSCG